MKHHENVKIIALVGLTGSGKSTAVDYLTEKGYPKVYFGGIIYQAMKDAGVEITFESQKEFREKIREEEGKDFVVKRAIKQTRDLIASGQHRIVLDGIYSWTEYKLVKHEFPGELTVAAIITPKHQRKSRLAVRAERPLTSAEVDQRDWAEIENLEKGGPIAIADYFITNNGDLGHMQKQIDEILTHIDF
jgi:dephospho-CoA kinase